MTLQVVETSVTVNNNSPIQDYVHPYDQTQPTFEMTPGFKPFTAELSLSERVRKPGKQLIDVHENSGFNREEKPFEGAC